MDTKELKEYFEKASGHGILATVSGDGLPNQAVFSRPHFMADGTVAFIMPHKLTHRNLQENPHAAYLFIETGSGYKGRRIYLTKVREEQDTELLRTLRRRPHPSDRGGQDGPRFLVFFRVDMTLRLIGTGGSAA
ncbi:MAG TPA: pyridoxamine 5'-phosphate oxidase family protein [Syntrophobacter fumaroxidans]|nr:pyridoxamine 5'-phosphate oxidase family protein [Syntrophobacter fumaroxidans]